jgi:carboxyl-terminal processing protease
MAFSALLTPQQRQLNIQSFDYVWSAIRDRHWDPKLGGLDWQAVRDELRPRMEKADSMPEARSVLHDMIARLHESHCNVIPADVYEHLGRSDPFGPESGEGSAGFDFRVIGGKTVVTSVEEGSSAAVHGVRPGWVLLQIDGAELAPLIEDISKSYRGSTWQDLMLNRTIGARLAGPAGAPLTITFLDGNDKPREIGLTRGKPKGFKSQFGYLPAHYTWIATRRLAGNIGYIRFNFFLDPARLMKAFGEAVQSCLPCEGVVIDLRGNPGGLGIMAMGMAGWFIEKPNQRLGTMYMRETTLQFVVNPRIGAYQGPLALLVDGGSASTSEVFAGGLKDLGRARLFGTRTAGAALPSVFERLPNGDGFQYAVANYISAGGRPLEGVGVAPDVEAPLTREALLAGRDPALEAALEWIRNIKEQP